jgi:hypothetical protein
MAAVTLGLSSLNKCEYNTESQFKSSFIKSKKTKNPKGAIPLAPVGGVTVTAHACVAERRKR